MGLDAYGYPATMVANSLLVRQEEYADSGKELEKAWRDWLHYYPFDAGVAERLAVFLRGEISRLEGGNDARRQLLERKLAFVTQKIERYDRDNFFLVQ
ncbi:MAG: hypothetical protein Kow0089_08580 [Desulfobulbaceae bacterium]